MSADPAADELGQAICLNLEPDGVLAFLHSPAPVASRDVAVLLCPPFGWEEACSYRGLRTWAATLARDGYHAARLALPAVGDGAGSPRDPGRLAAWSEAVAGAAGWLREVSGAARVAAVGIGLGGAVALKAVGDGAAVDELVLWSVPASGRRLIREMQIHANMVAAEFPEDQRSPAAPGEDLELIGYVLSAETARELGELRLDQLNLPAGRLGRALLLGRDGLGVDTRLQGHLEQAGAAVTVADGTDYVGLMANPQQSQAPRQTVALTSRWLGEGHGVGAPAATASAPRASPTLQVRRGDAELRETPLRVHGPRGRIFGVLCQGADGTRTDLCVILLNAGALPHAGPNRAWVELARSWAARGVASLRVDLAGVGEADGDDPALLSDPSLYAEWRDAEVRAILDELDRRDVADRFVLGGLCSGAYRAARLAQVDHRVAGALLINLYTFRWSQDLVSERGRRRELAGGLPNIRAQPVGRALVAKALHYSRPDRAWRMLRGPAERAQKAHSAQALDALRDQGVETLLLLARGEPLYDQLARHGLLDQLHRWPNLTVQRVPSRDHMFRALWLQREVYAALDQSLERIRAAATRGPAATGRR